MLLVAYVLPWLVAATNNPVLPPTTSWHEHYAYETVRVGDTSPTCVERVTMQYQTTNGALYMHYRSEHDKGMADEINIRCNLDGSNVVAIKQQYSQKGKRLSDASIGIANGKVHVEQLLDDGRKKVRSHDTEGKPVAADASLMALFRFFPFDQGQTQNVLIATFTQHFVTMEVKQLGTETLTVPAGSIECYKLEGVVDLFVTRIRTVYWLNKKEPHFLVRYEGKRGLFLSPSYVTSLVTIGEPQGTNSIDSPAMTTTNTPSLTR